MEGRGGRCGGKRGGGWRVEGRGVECKGWRDEAVRVRNHVN